MKFKLLITIITVCKIVLVNSVEANAQLLFQKLIGSSNHETYLNGCMTPSGGLIISGETKPTTGFSDAFAICLNNNFDTVWNFTYGGNDNDYFSSVKNTIDSGFIFTGTTSSFSSGRKALVVKTDVNGIIQWAKTYGGTLSDYGTNIIQTSDNGFVVVGSTTSFGAGSNDIYLFKIDAIGNLQWAKAFGGSSVEYGFNVIETTDHGFTVIGSTSSFCTSYSSPPYIFHTDSSGTLVWSKCLGMTGVLTVPHIVITGTDYIIAGSLNTGTTSNVNAYMMRLGPTGNIIWTRRYDVSSSGETAFCFTQTTDNGFVLSGQTYSCGSGGADAFLLKLNLAGDTVWTRVFGTGNNEGFYYMTETSDEGFLLLGTSYVSPNNNGDIFLVKTDSSGNIPSCVIDYCGFEKFNSTVASSNPASSTVTGGVQNDVTLSMNYLITSIIDLCGTVGMESVASNGNTLVFPNPFSTETTLKVIRQLKEATLTIYNNFGQMVKKISQITTGADKSITLHRENLPNGLYFIRLTENSKIISVHKLVVVDK